MAKEGGKLDGLTKGNYRPLVILVREAGYSSNPGEGVEAKKLRLPGDLVVGKVRERFLDR